MQRTLQIFDAYFEFVRSLGGMTLPEEVLPPEMIDNTRSSKYEGITSWKLIKSRVEDAEIASLVELYGKGIPDSFQSFLQYKCYLDLQQVGKWGINFFDVLPQKGISKMIEAIKTDYQAFINENYLVFAEYGDSYGVICFDANKEKVNLDYDIVMIAFDEMKPRKIAENFDDLFIKIEVWLEDWKASHTEKQ